MPLVSKVQVPCSDVRWTSHDCAGFESSGKDSGIKVYNGSRQCTTWRLNAEDEELTVLGQLTWSSVEDKLPGMHKRTMEG